MLIELSNEQLCLLIEKLIEKNRTNDILYYAIFVNFDEDPYILLHMGDYFRKNDHEENMFYYYNKALTYETTKNGALFGICCYYVSKDMYKEFHELAEKNNFDKEMYTKVADKFFLPNVDLMENKIFSQSKLDFVAEIFSKYNDVNSLEKMNLIHKLNKNYGQYIKTHIVLLKKFNNNRSHYPLESMIRGTMRKMYDERIEEYNKKIFSFYPSNETCFICHKSVHYYFTTECKHNICSDCSYEKLSDDCMMYCTCGQKSSLLFNLMINYCQTKGMVV